MGSIETVFSIIILVMTGYVLKSLGVLREEDATPLNRVVINVAIPSLIFTSLYRADLAGISHLLLIPAVCILTGFISGAMAFTWTRYRGMDSRTAWSLVIPAAMMNSGFLGYPVTLGIFGSEGLVRAIFYDTGTTILFTLLGLSLAISSGAPRKTVLRRTILFPPLWAFLLGITFNLLGIHLGLGGTVLGYLSGAAVPLIMISLGLTINFRFFRDSITDAAAVSSIRLVLSPLIAALLACALAFRGIEMSVIILEASMPSAMLAAVLAIENELDVGLTSACIFMSTSLALVSIPLWTMVL